MKHFLKWLALVLILAYPFTLATGFTTSLVGALAGMLTNFNEAVLGVIVFAGFFIAILLAIKFSIGLWRWTASDGNING